MKINVPLKQVNLLVVHNTASTWGDANVINDWHYQRFLDLKKKGKEDMWKVYRDAGGKIIYAAYHILVLNGFNNYVDLKNNKRNRDLDGKAVVIRPETIQGQHAKNCTHKSLSICLVGAGTYTDKQFDTTFAIIIKWLKQYGMFKTWRSQKQVLGHLEVPGNKTSCPEYNMNNFRSKLQYTIENETELKASMIMPVFTAAVADATMVKVDG